MSFTLENLVITNSNFSNNYFSNGLFNEVFSNPQANLTISNTQFSNIFPNSNTYYTQFPGSGTNYHSNQFYISSQSENRAINLINLLIYTNNVFPIFTITGFNTLSIINITIIGQNSTSLLDSYSNKGQNQALTYKNNYLEDLQSYTNYSIPSLYCFQISYGTISSILIQNSSFINIYTVYSVLYLMSNLVISKHTTANITIDNCIFKDNTALGGSALRILLKSDNYYDYWVQIMNCKFINNQCKNATETMILFTFYSYYLFVNSLINDIMPGYGGAIRILYMLREDSLAKTQRKRVYFQNCLFSNNSADLAGGAIYSDYYPVDFDNTTIYMENNHAPYGPDIGSKAIRLEIMKQKKEIVNYNWNESLQIVKNLSSIVSFTLNSGPMDETLYFILFDIYGQIIKSDLTSTLNVDYGNDLYYSIPSTVIAESGIYEYAYDYSEIGYLPNTTVLLNVTSNGIVNTYGVNIPNISIAIINATFRLCKIGEIYSQYTCRYCQNQTYSLSLDPFCKGPCQTCDNDKSVCKGGKIVLPKAGYWRMNMTSDIIINCPNPSACKGSPDITNTSKYSSSNEYILNSCEKGYENNLCDICSLGYGKNGASNECVECNTNIWYYFWIFGILLIQILLLAMTILPSIKGTATTSAASTMDQNLSTREASYIKILTNFTQINILISTLKIPMPNFSISISNGLNFISIPTTQVFSSDCLINSSSNQIFFFKSLINMAVPITLILALIICSMIRKTYFIKNKNKFIMASMILAIYYQQPLLQIAFSFYQCVNLYRDDQPEFYIINSLDVKCMTNAYWAWTLSLSLPVIVVWGIIIPLGFSYIIRRSRINYHALVQNYSFLVMGYRKDSIIALSWESYYVIRRLILVILTIIIPYYSIPYTLILCNGVIFLGIIAQIYWKPYDNEMCNRLEKLCLFGSYFNYMSVSYFTLPNINLALELIMATISLIFTVSIIMYWSLQYIRINIIKIKYPKIRTLLFKIFGNPENFLAKESQTKITPSSVIFDCKSSSKEKEEVNLDIHKVNENNDDNIDDSCLKTLNMRNSQQQEDVRNQTKIEFNLNHEDEKMDQRNQGIGVDFF